MEFLNSSKGNLTVNYKYMLDTFMKGISLTDTFLKSRDPQSGCSASPAYPTCVQKFVYFSLKHSDVVEIADIVLSFLEKPVR